MGHTNSSVQVRCCTDDDACLLVLVERAAAPDLWKASVTCLSQRPDDEELF
jgi:hypothetical protein